VTNELSAYSATLKDNFTDRVLQMLEDIHVDIVRSLDLSVKKLAKDF